MREQTPLPTLTGSEKQIAWASEIRERLLAEYDAALANVSAPEPVRIGFAVFARAGRARLAAMTSASCWIDRRGFDGERLVHEEWFQQTRRGKLGTGNQVAALRENYGLSAAVRAELADAEAAMYEAEAATDIAHADWWAKLAATQHRIADLSRARAAA